MSAFSSIADALECDWASKAIAAAGELDDVARISGPWMGQDALRR